MAPRSAKNLREELEGYGVVAQNVRHFGQEKPKPDLQEYLTLNSLRRKNHPAPDGVVESQGRPILYFVDEQRLTKGSQVKAARLLKMPETTLNSKLKSFNINYRDYSSVV